MGTGKANSLPFQSDFEFSRSASVSSQTRRPPEQPALGGLRGADGDREEQRQGLLPRRAEDHAGHHGAPAAGPADGGELTAYAGGFVEPLLCVKATLHRLLPDMKLNADVAWKSSALKNGTNIVLYRIFLV